MSFQKLADEAQVCTRCPDLAEKTAVLGPGNGDPSADLFFLGEAPGRFGCDLTRVPFSGDQSGDRFEALLEHIGLTRNDIFVTNAVLCNPLTAEGNNRKPSAAELENCAEYLEHQLAIVDPRIVVTVGATGLGALKRIEGHGLRLRDAVAETHDWNGRVLYPVYHTSPLARTHRSEQEQREDWKGLGELVRGL